MEILWLVMAAFGVGIIGLISNAWLSKNELERKYLQELIKNEERNGGKSNKR